MSNRLTVVIQYEEDQEQPAFFAYMPVLGGKCVAVQFNDALRETEDRDDIVDRLRGNLQNCVNHLESSDINDSFKCILSANKVLRDTLGS